MSNGSLPDGFHPARTPQPAPRKWKCWRCIREEKVRLLSEGKTLGAKDLLEFTFVSKAALSHHSAQRHS